MIGQLILINVSSTSITLVNRIICALFIDLPSNFFLENHSHMLSGNHDNETTLRLLYYPPVIQEDDNKCEMTKGRCKYSQQRCNGNDVDMIPPRDVKTDKSSSDTEDDADEVDDNNGNVSDHSKSSKSSRSSSEGELTVTRCGAHCK